MAEKILNTRVLLKLDTLENWGKSTLQLKKGEIAFATVAATEGTGLTEPVIMAKIASEDGKTFNELPWAFHAKSSDVLAACKTEAGLKAFIAAEIAGAGIATDEAMQALAARVTTAEGAIDAVEALVGEKAVATQIEEAIAALDLANTYDAKGAAADALADAKTYADGKDEAIAAAQKAGDDAAAAVTALADGAVKTNTDAITAIKDGAALDSFKDVEDKFASEATANDGKYAAKAATEAHIADGDIHVTAEQKTAWTTGSEAGNAAKAWVDANSALLTGDGVGSVAEAKAAADAAQIDVDALAAQVGEVVEGKTVVEMINDAKVAATYDDTQVKADIQTNADAIAKLNDGATVEGSVDYKIAQAVAAIMENPDDTMNSINELVTWCNDHAADALELSNKVSANETDIAALEGLVGSTAVATQITDAIAAALKIEGVDKYALATDLTAAIGRIAAMEAKVADWDDAVAKEHEHANKALLDTYTQTEADLADAVAKKHEHTFVESELNKIVDGDVAKWNAAQANAEKTAADALAGTKTELEGKITSAETAASDALAAARTEIAAEIDADVKVVNDALEAYKTSNDAAVAGVKATADSAVQTVTANTGLVATKTGTDVAIYIDDSVTFVFDCGNATA